MIKHVLCFLNEVSLFDVKLAELLWQTDFRFPQEAATEGVLYKKVFL